MEQKGGTNMEGTSRRRIGRQLRAFWQESGRLLVFLLLFLTGVGIGCPAFSYGSDALQSTPSLWLLYPSSGSVTADVLTVFAHACIIPGLLLLLLMAAGLSAIGAPTVFAVPFLYGVSVGFCEAYVYTADGLWQTAWMLLPPTLVALWTLLMAACESLRMTLRIVGQIAPRGCAGGLWTDCKRYFMRYFIFAGLTLLQAAMQTLLVCIARP